MAKEDHERPLDWQVIVSKRAGLTKGVPPGRESFEWVANSSTLIYGKRDAVLVDTFLTIDSCNELADRIEATAKNLHTIYITHAHGDHFFGLAVLQHRFPKARAFALPEVAKPISPVKHKPLHPEQSWTH